jgi:hypothetical protein
MEGKMHPYLWEAWEGKKIARCESKDGATVIILEDGRGIKFWVNNSDILYFVAKDTAGKLWPDE